MSPADATERPPVLCVEAHVALADLMCYTLKRAGYAVHIARGDLEAQQIAMAVRPALVLLDLQVPGIDGLALCAYFRTRLQLPVILLGAPASDEEVVDAFQHGADDYIAKPFNPQVLLYRISAVLRGTAAAAPAAGQLGIYLLGSAVFDASQNEVIGAREQTRLTPIEGAILQLLVRHPRQVFSAEQILARVWDADRVSSPMAVRAHIHRLRGKLTRVLGGLDYIHTEPGRGYSYRNEGV